MECVQKQYPTHHIAKPAQIRSKIHTALKQTEVYDKESAEFRRHLASEAAIRQMERRKALSAAVAHRMAFMR
jgi:hypothetical protein